VIERLQAYRQRLLKAGKLLEARAVEKCIKLVKAHAANPQ
jgi:hypothetical protein